MEKVEGCYVTQDIEWQSYSIIRSLVLAPDVYGAYKDEGLTYGKVLTILIPTEQHTVPN